MLYALLFLPALLALAWILRPRRERIVEEAATTADNPFDTLESLLAELERSTLAERDVAELEALAGELERAARELERVA
ncbi:MAG TPA: hypothetical protein VFL60_03860 [Gaiellaceae bacterium]|nr:hypothetical protein [Gaiellaceae bacterium]